VREDEMELLNWAALQAAKKASDLYRSRAGFDKAGQLIDAFLSRYDLILTPTTGGACTEAGRAATRSTL
jgi:amidase/aspartyl-tRNA(Asn)/glutamyl-tRNA(Gln) amidotransferase subunit A